MNADQNQDFNIDLSVQPNIDPLIKQLLNVLHRFVCGGKNNTAIQSSSSNLNSSDGVIVTLGNHHIPMEDFANDIHPAVCGEPIVTRFILGGGGK